jgi:hypothetical protein
MRKPRGIVVRKQDISTASTVLAIVLGVCLFGRWQHASAQVPQPPSASSTILLDDSTGVPETLSPIPSVTDEMLMSDEDFYNPALPADCGMSCLPAWYVRTEALMMSNESYDQVSLSTNFNLPAFSYEPALRVTAGRRRDCSEGWEVSYMGLLEWESRGSLLGYPLDTRLVSPSGEINLSAFERASAQTQTYTSSLYSIEAHQRLYDWDTLSWQLGLRYLDFRESFGFFSQSLAPEPVESGAFRLGVHNRLIGPQAGVELLHPIGPTNLLTVSGRLKGGVYANISDSTTQLVNAGVVQLNNNADRTQLAATVELGLLANLQITPRFSVHGGYEVWYLTGVALAPAQRVSPMTLDTGRGMISDQDTWFHGATLGVQYTW